MTGLSCLSITACRAPLDVLERLSYSREELAGRLASLRSNSEARAVAVLSTCQRTEVYATWPGAPDDPALLAALALDRGIPTRVLRSVARTYRGDAAARHLLRVASGLESFVLGETEIAGQVRAAADLSRAAGGADAELERLMDAAISASRKRQRRTSIAAATRSVAAVAVEAVTRSNGGTLAGQRLLVVGAGQVASVVVARAVELGAVVTVCNRTSRRAHRFAAAGAAVVDLADLAERLAASDIAILATTAPHPLVDAHLLRSARAAGAGPLTLVDLSMPRNVDPVARALPWIRLIDLADLRSDGTADAGDLVRDLAATEEIIETELQRYLRWLASRSAAAALHRMRSGAEDIAREELARNAGGLPPEIRSSMERVLLKIVHRLVHKPTLELRAAAAADDGDLVEVLAGLFDPASAHGQAAAGTGLLAGEPDTAARRRRPPLDAQRLQARAVEQAGHERGVHRAHKLTM
jgi:glutamyl-tRNA reductase